MATRDKLLAHLLAVLVILLGGGWLFALLDHQNYLDALYNVVMVLTLVGGNTPNTAAGKIFNMFLSLISAGILLSFTAQIFAPVYAKQVIHSMKERRLLRMKGHTILCGVSHTLHELLTRLPKESTLLIVRSQDEADLLARSGIRAHVDDYTTKRALTEAGIDTAGLVIASSEDDADNAFVCLTAKKLRPDVKVIARISHEESREKMLEVGADAIVSPSKLAADATLDLMQQMNGK